MTSDGCFHALVRFSFAHFTLNSQHSNPHIEILLWGDFRDFSSREIFQQVPTNPTALMRNTPISLLANRFGCCIMTMQLLGKGIRCFSTAPSKVIQNWQFVLLLIHIYYTGPRPPQGPRRCAWGEEKEGKACSGGSQVWHSLHRPHACHGVGWGWRLAGYKDFLLFGVDNNCQVPKIVPQGPLAIHPGATALQYAQVMFCKFQIKKCNLTLLFSRSLREWKLCGALMTRSRYYLTTRILNHYIIWQKKGRRFDSTCGKLISLSALMLQLREKQQIFFNVENELFCQQVRLFRPRHNLARINVSAARACLPKVTCVLVGVVVVFPWLWWWGLKFCQCKLSIVNVSVCWSLCS